MVTNNAWNSQDPAQVAKGGTGLATATAYAVVCGGTTATGAFQSIAGVGSSGEVLTSNGAGALPTFQAASAGGLTWNAVTGTSQAAAVDNGYIADNASLVTITLPATAAVGSIVRVAGKGAGLWKLSANTSDTINFGNQVTSAAGSITATHRYDSIEVLCITTDSVWVVLSSVGNFTIA